MVAPTVVAEDGDFDVLVDLVVDFSVTSAVSCLSPPFLASSAISKAASSTNLSLASYLTRWPVSLFNSSSLLSNIDVIPQALHSAFSLRALRFRAKFFLLTSFYWSFA